jgi:hypothetical protein
LQQWFIPFEETIASTFCNLRQILLYRVNGDSRRLNSGLGEVIDSSNVESYYNAQGQ